MLVRELQSILQVPPAQTYRNQSNECQRKALCAVVFVRLLENLVVQLLRV